MNTRGILESDLRSDGKLMINITGDDVWMTRSEITEFLGIFTQSFVANLREIFRRRELLEDEVTLVNDKGPIFYSLDVILALLFKCKGGYCKPIRDWIKYRIQKPLIEHRQPIMTTLGGKGVLS